MKRLLAWLVGLSVLAGAAVAVAGAWAWRTLHEPVEPGAALAFEVPPGESARSILGRLEAEHLIVDATLARLYLIHLLDDPPLQAGEYRFSGAADTPAILDKLVRGEVVLHPVTVIEGLTLEEIGDHLAARGLGALDAFLQAMRDPALIADLDPEATDLEGYLFPDTYHFAKGATEAEIVATLVEAFRAHFTRHFEDLELGIRELVTLASVVEKEAALDSERTVIAGVYRNRLDRGIALYADPTIIFALKKLGRWDGDIRRRDLSLDSPYNTYLYSGLPPGPICSPGLASLQAAAAPAEVPYLYFVSRNDGSHVFAETLREHNRNVDEWQRRYWREKAKRGRK